MLTELIGEELQIAANRFRDRITSELACRAATRFSNPDGLMRRGVNYETRTPSGHLSIVVVPADAEPSKLIHAVTLNPTDPLDPRLRLNLSKRLDGRGKTSTVIAMEQPHGRRYICHRGDVTIFKWKPPAAEVRTYFATYEPPVMIINKGKCSTYPAIGIGDVDSPDLFAAIALFAHRLEEFKRQYR